MNQRVTRASAFLLLLLSLLLSCYAFGPTSAIQLTPTWRFPLRFVRHASAYSLTPKLSGGDTSLSSSSPSSSSSSSFLSSSSSSSPSSSSARSASMASAPEQSSPEQFNPPPSRMFRLPPTSPAPPLTATPPKKVFLMVEPTPFTHISGYSNRYVEMLRFLSKAGDDVSVVTTDQSSNPPNSTFGFPVKYTWGFSSPWYPVVVSFDIPQFRGLRVLSRFRNPDVIHVTIPGFMIFVTMAYARLFRIPLVVTYHTHLPEYAVKYAPLPGIRAFAWWLVKFTSSAADLVLVTSPQMAQEFAEHGIKRVDIWRKGIDTQRFSPKYKSAEMRARMLAPTGTDPSTCVVSKSDSKPFLMLYVGRISEEKRIAMLKPILEKIPNAHLCVVGGGPMDAQFRSQFSGHPRATFLGTLVGDELSSAFASADALVMPSDSETLGFVVLEAMASGTPVVAARAGGIPSLVEEGVTGLLAKPLDVDDFVKQINYLKNNKKERETMSKKGREEAERWNWEAATSVLRNVQYQTAVDNFKRRGLWGLESWRSIYLRERLRNFWMGKKAISAEQSEPR